MGHAVCHTAISASAVCAEDGPDLAMFGHSRAESDFGPGPEQRRVILA